jgi:hypothetical protein
MEKIMNFLRNLVMLFLLFSPSFCFGSEQDPDSIEMQKELKDIKTHVAKIDEMLKTLQEKCDEQKSNFDILVKNFTQNNSILQMLVARTTEQGRFNKSQQDSKEEKRPRTKSKEEKKKNHENGSSKEKES